MRHRPVFPGSGEQKLSSAADRYVAHGVCGDDMARFLRRLPPIAGDRAG